MCLLSLWFVGFFGPVLAPPPRCLMRANVKPLRSWWSRLDISSVRSAYVSILLMGAFRCGTFTHVVSLDWLSSLFRSGPHSFRAFMSRVFTACLPFSGMFIFLVLFLMSRLSFYPFRAGWHF